MALDNKTVIVPGRGTVLFAAPNTAAPDFTRFDLATESSHAGWSISHTSKENMVSFDSDGGDLTQLGSWEADAIYATQAPLSLSITINKLQLDEETLKLQFGATGNAWDAATKSLKIKSISPTAKAVCLIMVGADGRRGGFYMPNVTLGFGDAPSLDAEAFFEVSLNGAILAGSDGMMIQAFAIRDFDTATSEE